MPGVGRTVKGEVWNGIGTTGTSLGIGIGIGIGNQSKVVLPYAGQAPPPVPEAPNSDLILQKFPPEDHFERRVDPLIRLSGAS